MSVVKDLDLRWNDEVTLNFVRLYLRHEWLWNPRHKDHKNQRKRQASYLLLMADCAPYSPGLTVERVKQKIRILRTMYCQEVRKKVTGRGNPLRVSRWFKEMDQSLGNVTLQKKTIKQTMKSDDVLIPDSWQDPEENIKEFKNCEYQNINPRQSTKNSSNKDHISSLIMNNNRSINSIKNKNNISSFTTNEMSKASIENKDTVHVNSDEFDRFSQHIASQLRDLSPALVIKAQVDIQNILTIARLSGM